MPDSLGATNTMLAVIAAVSVIQGLVCIGFGVAGWKIYKLATGTIREIDEKRVKPIAAKVEGLVDRAHQVTDRVHQLTERVQQRAEKVEETATHVKSSVTDTVHRVSDAVTGLRAALINALTTDEGDGHRHHSRFAHPPRTAAEGGYFHHEETRDVRGGGF
jgi:uncharacterized protein YoxC